WTQTSISPTQYRRAEPTQPVAGTGIDERHALPRFSPTKSRLGGSKKKARPGLPSGRAQAKPARQAKLACSHAALPGYWHQVRLLGVLELRNSFQCVLHSAWQHQLVID